MRNLLLIILLILTGCAQTQEEIISNLIEQLGSDDITDHNVASSQLYLIGAPVIPSLINALKSENANTRYSAVLTLGRIRNQSTVASLIPLLKDNNREVRLMVVRALGDIGDKKTVSLLFAVLENEDVCFRVGAIKALGKIKDTAATDFLIKTLRDKDKDVRNCTAWALGEIGNENAIKPLINVLSDENVYVRLQAMHALGKIGNKSAINSLIPLLTDETASIRGCAACTLGKIGANTVVNSLLELLRDANNYVSNCAMWSLATLRDESAVNSLMMCLYTETGDRNICLQATRILASIGEPVIQPLLLALENRNDNTRYYAMAALGGINYKEVSLELHEAVLDAWEKILQEEKDTDVYSMALVAFSLSIGNYSSGDDSAESTKRTGSSRVELSVEELAHSYYRVRKDVKDLLYLNVKRDYNSWMTWWENNP